MRGARSPLETKGGSTHNGRIQPEPSESEWLTPLLVIVGVRVLWLLFNSLRRLRARKKEREELDQVALQVDKLSRSIAQVSSIVWSLPTAGLLYISLWQDVGLATRVAMAPVLLDLLAFPLVLGTLLAGPVVAIILLFIVEPIRRAINGPHRSPRPTEPEPGEDPLEYANLPPSHAYTFQTWLFVPMWALLAWQVIS